MGSLNVYKFGLRFLGFLNIYKLGLWLLLKPVTSKTAYLCSTYVTPVVRGKRSWNISQELIDVSVGVWNMAERAWKTLSIPLYVQYSITVFLAFKYYQIFESREDYVWLVFRSSSCCLSSHVLKVLSIEMDLAESSLIRQVVVKNWGSEVLRKIRSFPILWAPVRDSATHRTAIGN